MMYFLPWSLIVFISFQFAQREAECFIQGDASDSTNVPSYESNPAFATVPEGHGIKDCLNDTYMGQIQSTCAVCYVRKTVRNCPMHEGVCGFSQSSWDACNGRCCGSHEPEVMYSSCLGRYVRIVTQCKCRECATSRGELSPGNPVSQLSRLVYTYKEVMLYRPFLAPQFSEFL